MTYAEEIAWRVAQGKREILQDVAAGTVPASARDFSELHDYVDANEYGGLCDGDRLPPIDVCNGVQDALADWIRGGGLKNVSQ